MWIFFEKRPFFRADMARLGKYCMGGYGRIGVYRDNILITSEVLVSKHDDLNYSYNDDVKCVVRK